MTAATARAGTVRLALATIGSVTVGIGVAGVVQALPVPPTLAALPRRGGALAGVIDARGGLTPVVDLARWVDTGSAAAAAGGAARRILVLRDGARCIGLLVDAIDGFADVPADAVTRLLHDDDPDEVFQSAARVPQTGAVASILEVGRLVALACAWRDAEAGTGTGAAADEAAAAGAAREATGVPCAVLQAGATLLALPAARLAAVVPRPALERVGTGALFCQWRGRHVPVIDALAVCAPAPAAVFAGSAAVPGSRPLLAIVEHDGAVLGLLVDAAVDMRALVPPGTGAAVTTLYDGGDAIEFVDSGRLFAGHPETALSILFDGARAAPPGGRPVNDAAQMVFDADGTMATPIAAVEQVLPLQGAGDACAATMPWQGRAIPLADLRRGKPEHGTVLVVRHGGQHVACVVERVRTIVPPGEGRLFSMAPAGQAGACHFIAVRDGTGEASYRIVDLGMLARAALAR